MMTIAELAATDLANTLCSFIDEAGCDLINTPLSMCRMGYGHLTVVADYWYDTEMFDIMDDGFLFYS